VTAVRLALGTLAIATAATTGLTMIRTGVQPAFATLIVAASLAFVATGLIVWHQRPAAIIGPLMWVVGMAWLIPQWRYGGESITWTLGTWLLPTLHQAALTHVVFAYPSGVIRSQAERSIVVTAYVTATLGGFVVAAFARDPASLGFAGFPRNVLLVNPDVDVWRALVAVKTTFELLLAVAILALVARRWKRSSGLGRRRLGPFLFGGGLAAISFSAGYTALGIRSPFLSGIPLDYLVIRWPIAVLYLIVPVAIGWGVLRERLDRAGVVDLVSTAGEEGRGLAALQVALRSALRDRGLELLIWDRDHGELRRLDGTAGRAPDDGDRRIATHIERDGRMLGIVVHDRALVEDEALMDAVVASVRLVLDNQRLLSELGTRLEEVRASRGRIADAANVERRRIERNLHDGAQQQLVALSLLLSLAADGAASHEDERLIAQLDRARKLAADTLADVRSLAHGIHPAVLTEEGLGTAIDVLVRTSPVPVDVAGDFDERLPEATEAAIYYVVAEALTNVAKYADASRVDVRVARSPSGITVDVEDDGIGGATLTGGSGLQGLADRVEALGGSFEVRSPRGAGTRVRASLPCA
jgi:signal transduction histidine kinase